MGRNGGDEEMKSTVRKGPWKSEEDEVLLNHVKKYGPRDWSSIRSKSLLQRTGKSCRLRWVNKLRPNLKNGCKFSVEEERTVIELQAQFGNKWAKIATHLSGRTDNDVKNFWSSRQKRLARILQSNTPYSKSQKKRKENHSFEAANKSCLMKGESSSKDSGTSSLLDNNNEMTKMVPLPNYADHSCLDLGPNVANPEPIPLGKNSSNELQQHKHLQLFSLPQSSELPLSLVTEELIIDELIPMGKNLSIKQQPHEPPLLFSSPQSSELPLSMVTEELIHRLDSSFMNIFDGMDTCEIMQLPGEELPYFRGKVQTEKPMTPDSNFDDFPTDMFDQIEHLPSPSDW
ncbi:hypothetical protein Nepgr_002472 [Nepenthes gracilis]|uniref:Uncharacterized protein n=1 Tax=Nepenthes gracilis TaxID=150966 RepID=A0AAD3RY99_NEPGR|nr:hypothetical protein Nepgr_002472 [Nepenthes gracilis]